MKSWTAMLLFIFIQSQAWSQTSAPEGKWKIVDPPHSPSGWWPVTLEFHGNRFHLTTESFAFIMKTDGHCVADILQDHYTGTWVKNVQYIYLSGCEASEKPDWDEKTSCEEPGSWKQTIWFDSKQNQIKVTVKSVDSAAKTWTMVRAD